MDTKYKVTLAAVTGMLVGFACTQPGVDSLQNDYANALNEVASAHESYHDLSLKYIDLTQQCEALKVLLEDANDNSAAVPLYTIPISEELQMYTYNTCSSYGVDYELVLAIMWQESNFDATAISATGDYGLMQINKSNHSTLKQTLGFTDILDPESNIAAGIYMLSELSKRYDNTHEVLMAYNMGEGKAESLWKSGKHSSTYSELIASKYLLITQNQYSASY